MIGRLVLVRWVDVASNSEWHNAAELDATQPVECSSVGYIRRVDVKRLILSHTMCGTDGDMTVYPRGCITSVVSLQPGASIELPYSKAGKRA